jgi:hypothetical protein
MTVNEALQRASEECDRAAAIAIAKCEASLRAHGFSERDAEFREVTAYQRRELAKWRAGLLRWVRAVFGDVAPTVH